MTMKNIVVGFKCTGVYPLDRSVQITEQTSMEKSHLAEKCGLNFIPFFSPARKRLPKHVEAFSDEEHRKYTRRFEEGYDIVDDEQYDKWLEIYHPSLKAKMLNLMLIFMMCNLMTSI